jgi:hypothetical protein
LSPGGYPGLRIRCRHLQTSQKLGAIYTSETLVAKTHDDQKIRIKFANFSKIAQNVTKLKKGQNNYNKAQFETPKHL